jgi:hypothetical protein
VTRRVLSTGLNKSNFNSHKKKEHPFFLDSLRKTLIGHKLLELVTLERKGKVMNSR